MNAPEVLARPLDYTKEQLDIIRSTLAPGLDDNQFAYYIEVCKRLGLDPFAKEIHVQLRKQRGRDGEPDTYKIVIMIGIDGYRRRAADTGELDGQTEPQWCGEDEVWKNVWVAKTPPVAARIGVLRKGCSQPFWGVALFSEYVAMEPDGYDHRTKRVTSWKVSTTWKKMPVGQLAKCSESLALRKAFPRELGALRTTEEMERSQHDPEDLERVERLASPSADTTASPGAGATEGKALAARTVADKQAASMDALAARIVEVAKQGAITVPIPLPKPPEDSIPAFTLYGIRETIGG